MERSAEIRRGPGERLGEERLGEVGRAFAGLVALIACASTIARVWLTFERVLARGGSFAEALWVHLGFFTNLTNMLVAVVLGFAAFGYWPRRFPPLGATLAAATLYIVLVAVVYHTLLSGMWNPRGLALIVDVGLHSLVPGLTLVVWLLFAPKQGLAPRHAFLWLIFPAVYFGVVMLRGATDGWYPYPFLNVARLGLWPVIVNAAAIAAGLVLAGLAMIYASRAFSRAAGRAEISRSA